MDADGRIIPIVEGDQGEGFKDEIDPHETDEYREALKKQSQLVTKGPSHGLDAPEAFDKLAKDQLKPKDPPPPQRILMQVGMPINFYGYQYRVTKILNRGRIMLKFLGPIPEAPKGGSK